MKKRKLKKIKKKVIKLANNKKIILFLLLIVNIFGIILAYRNYINIAIELSQFKSFIFAYCAIAVAIASIGITFVLLGKEKRGEFLELFSVSWLMFFGLIAIVFAFVYSGRELNVQIISDSFGWIIIHSYMVFQGLYFIKEVKTKEIWVPLLLGLIILIAYITLSDDFLKIIIFWFFKSK